MASPTVAFSTVDRLFMTISDREFADLVGGIERRERGQVPWRWEDRNGDRFLDEGEVRFANGAARRRLLTGGRLNATFWGEALSLVNAGIPAVILQILIDRWKNGDPANDVPISSCPRDGSFERCAAHMRLSFNPRDVRFFQGGDVAGIIQTLPEIEALGADGIWISPLSRQARIFAQGVGPESEKGIAAYHGYWSMNHAEVEPRFGSWEFVRRFTREARRRGLVVVGDIPLNHSSPRKGIVGDFSLEEDAGVLQVNGRRWSYWQEHAALGLARDQFAASPDGKTIYNHLPSISDWDEGKRTASDCDYWNGVMVRQSLAELADLNTANPDVRRALLDAGKILLAAGIAAFRIDALKHADFAPACSPPGYRNIAVAVAEMLRRGVKGYSPTVGEWAGAMRGGSKADVGVPFFGRYFDLLDFGFGDAVHRSFGARPEDGQGRLEPLRRYLRDYLSLPEQMQAGLTPFINCHDFPNLANRRLWPTDSARHGAFQLMYLMRGTKYFYGQDLKGIFDYDDTMGFFGEGGDPKNRIMVHLPNGGGAPTHPAQILSLTDNPTARLFAALNSHIRSHAPAIRNGSFTTAIRGARGPWEIGSGGTIALKRGILDDHVLFILVEGEPASADEELARLRVDFPAGIYEDVASKLKYEVTGEGRVRPLPGRYLDAVWKRPVAVSEEGRISVADGLWRSDQTQATYDIRGNEAALPPEAVEVAVQEEYLFRPPGWRGHRPRWMPTSDFPNLSGRVRIRYRNGIVEQVDVRGGKIQFEEGRRVITLATKPSAIPVRDYLSPEPKG